MSEIWDSNPNLIPSCILRICNPL
uniref:Uncharacterized protein n=1 Tax=Rhizophora mucronata TaxID=61149 RepID=A0A2P2QAB6_RHIMU